MNRLCVMLLIVLSLLVSASSESFASSLKAGTEGSSPPAVVLGGTLLVREAPTASCRSVLFLGRRADFHRVPENWPAHWSGGKKIAHVALLGVDFADTPGIHRLVFEGCQNVTPLPVRVVGRHFMTSRLSVRKSFVRPPESFFARIRRESREIKRGLSIRSELAFDRSFSMPIKGHITHDFGAIRILNGTPLSRHSGEDIDAPEGLPVKAANAGTVVIAGKFYYDGNMVILDHGGGLFSEYLHLRNIRVRKGQRVARGEVVGNLGHTGRVTGPVLHYGAVLNQAHVNPLLLSDFPLAVVRIP